MKIVNPLYDHAFKYLMSNNRLAKKVLSVILDKEVLELELAQQEIIIEDSALNFTIYRLDFKAQILDESGKRETVLIELQKSKLPTNILRFRSYLGHSYTQKKETVNKDGGIDTMVYPIISIYIMGYNLIDIPYMATKIDRKVIDLSRQKEVHIESDFIDLLTHTCYILQVRRLPKKRRTRIEQFMTLFNQAWIKEEKYILDLEEIPEEFQDIATYLQTPLMDNSFKMRLKGEQELEGIFAKQEADFRLMEIKAEEALQKANAALEREEVAKQRAEEAKQKEEVAKQKAEEAKQKEEVAKQKAEEAKQREEIAKKRAEEQRKKAKEEKQRADQATITNTRMVQNLADNGFSIEDIIKISGLSQEEILKILN